MEIEVAEFAKKLHVASGKRGGCSTDTRMGAEGGRGCRHLTGGGGGVGTILSGGGGGGAIVCTISLSCPSEMNRAAFEKELTITGEQDGEEGGVFGS